MKKTIPVKRVEDTNCFGCIFFNMVAHKCINPRTISGKYACAVKDKNYIWVIDKERL